LHAGDIAQAPGVSESSVKTLMRKGAFGDRFSMRTVTPRIDGMGRGHVRVLARDHVWSAGYEAYLAQSAREGHASAVVAQAKHDGLVHVRGREGVRHETATALRLAARGTVPPPA
jgi:hypothetical protein